MTYTGKIPMLNTYPRESMEIGMKTHTTIKFNFFSGEQKGNFFHLEIYRKLALSESFKLKGNTDTGTYAENSCRETQMNQFHYSVTVK